MKRSIIAVFSMALLPLAAFAQLQDLQPAAVVKLSRTEPISVRQLKSEVQKMEAEANRSLTLSERRQVLDVMINERLALQAAERDKITVSDAEVNAQLAQLRAQLGSSVSDDQFAAAIKSDTGLDLAAYKESLRKQLIIQKYVLTKKRDVLEAIKSPSEDEIKALYELTKYRFIRPDTIRFSLIIVPITASLPAAEARSLADKLYKEISANPAKFDEIIIRAQAKDSQFQAQDGGYLPRTLEVAKIVGENFLTQAFALKVGEISPVLPFDTSFQIIKITESYLQKFLDLGDPVQLGVKGTIRDYLGSQLLEERSQLVIDQAQKELIAELRTGNTYEILENNLAW